MLNKAIIAITVSSLFVASGCSETSNSTQSQSSTIDNNASSSPPAWILTSAPTEDISVTQAKASVKEGDQVVIRGRIGGRKKPITEGSPVFTIVDLALEYCGQSGDDHCSVPWDYCCETPETIVSNSATVQLIGEKVNLDAAGLEPLDELVLIGTVGPRPDEQVLTILATGIYPVGG